MENFGLVTALKDFADSKGWAFGYGDEYWRNIGSDINLNDNQLILLADFTAKPIYSVNFKVAEIQYDGVIMLGRKFESITTKVTVIEDDVEIEKDIVTKKHSDLDETPFEKYSNRLLFLSQTLGVELGKFILLNELSVSNVNFRLDMNRFDSNIDFVAAQVTILQ